MSGIIGYLGERNAIPLLLDGLHHLEYRRYDSAGMTFIDGRSLVTVKKVGTVGTLTEAVNGILSQSTVGIAHTRWATHGEPTVMNAHPQNDCTETIAVVHNGIIENYAQLRRKLEHYHTFRSDTDTEVIPHLIEEHLKTEGTFESAVRRTMSEIKGTCGLVVLFAYEPRMMIAVCNGSPLMIGVGTGEYFVASDSAAFRTHTDRVIRLSDGEMALITPSGIIMKDLANRDVRWDSGRLSEEAETLEANGFPDFMLKEIFEQPAAVETVLRGRIDRQNDTVNLACISDHSKAIIHAKRLVILGCGSSWHAALAGKYMLEQYARIPVDAEYASEFRYRNPSMTEGDVVLAVSQSGESADTLAAVREAKRNGALVIGICNVVGSPVARLCDDVLYTHAGPEAGIASTKAYTSQLVMLVLVTLALMQEKRIVHRDGRAIMSAVNALPEQISGILEDAGEIASIAKEIHGQGNILFLGRGFNYPSALEAALKFREISSIHAAGYPAAEMKRGPFALIGDHMPVIVIAPEDSASDTIVSNIREVKSRNGDVLAVVDRDDSRISAHCSRVIRVPRTVDLLSPVLTIIPLQLLAYHVAVARGCTVDQRRVPKIQAARQ